VCNSGAL